jgi:acetyl esterase/lipase
LYYSDGICYATALREAGVEIAVKVVHGWPHTFWLKAPQLDKALEADMDMIEGLKWLIKLGDGLTQ